jgi:hypothetical protein
MLGIVGALTILAGLVLTVVGGALAAIPYFGGILGGGLIVAALIFLVVGGLHIFSTVSLWHSEVKGGVLAIVAAILGVILDATLLILVFPITFILIDLVALFLVAMDWRSLR